MAESALTPLAAGNAALAAGDWPAAHAAFTAALVRGDDPAAHDGLARSLWWTDGPGRAIEERTRAYAGYRRAGEDLAAAEVALWIAHEFQVGVGNPAAAGPNASASRRPHQVQSARGRTTAAGCAGSGRFSMQLSAYERPLRFATVERSRAATGTFEFRLLPQGDGTHVKVDMEIRPRGAMRLLQPVMRRMSERFLAELPEHVRQGLDSADLTS